MASQALQVLLCGQCLAFQVHIVKKAKKWECKLCGTKQSVIQVFGTGSGAECRILVQKLNESRHISEAAARRNLTGSEEFNFEENSARQEDQGETQLVESQTLHTGRVSKWDVYLDQDPSTNRLY
ncbi:MRN complex-interacting protein-like [Folsomia candida]|uniref:MRN complex-interacting protein-like n=1 Tax=Folsomia candida TaxID=158441 RepID=UPI000B8F0076|nr:MRN complex-interacting protein-like [Folsomia candida]